MHALEHLREASENYDIPLISEINATCKIIQGISLVALGNLRIHHVGILKVCHQSVDEDKVAEGGGQILAGYRLIKAGVDTNLPLIIMLIALGLFLSFT